MKTREQLLSNAEKAIRESAAMVPIVLAPGDLWIGAEAGGRLVMQRLSGVMATRVRAALEEEKEKP